jgi:hypothetical protein
VADTKRMAASGRRNFGFELHWTRCEVGQDTGNGLLCRVQRHNLLDVGFELSASNSPAQHVSQATLLNNALENCTLP